MNGVVMGLIFSDEILVPVPTAGEFNVLGAIDKIVIFHDMPLINMDIALPTTIEITVQTDEIVVEPGG